MITIYDINKRQRDLLETNKIDCANYSKLCVLNEKTGKIYRNNIDIKIKNWRGLSEDSTSAFIEACNTFFVLLENDQSQSNISNTAQFLINEATKPNDATALHKYFKYKFSRMKNIGKQKKSLKPKPITPQILSPTVPRTQSKKEFVDNLEKTFESTISSIVECDRIINNYNTITKRFNIDNIFKEYTLGKRSLYDAIYSTTACIASFDQPFKNVYYSAIETCCYELEKNYIKYNPSVIIEAITDFFIFSGGLRDSDIGDIFTTIQESPAFYIRDYINTVQYLKETPKIVENDNYTAEQLTEFYESKTTPEEIVDMPKLKITQEERESIKDTINEYKKACSKNEDSVMNAIGLKAFISQMCTKFPNDIPQYFNQILDLIRMSFVIYNERESIKETQDAIEQLITAAIKVPINSIRADNMILSLKKEITYINNRIEKLGDKAKNTTNKYEKYVEFINDMINKLKEFSDIANDSSNNEKIPEGLSEDELKNIEMESCKPLINICTKVINICESTIDPDVDEIISGNITKLPTGTTDSIIKIAKSNPDIISKEIIREALNKYKDSIKSSGPLSLTELTQIGLIGDQIYMLENSTTIYEKPSIDNLSKVLDVIKEACQIQNEPIIESNITIGYNTVISIIQNVLKYCIRFIKYSWIYSATLIILSSIEDILCKPTVYNDIREKYLIHIENFIHNIDNILYTSNIDTLSIKARLISLRNTLNHTIQRLNYIISINQK